MTGRYAQGAMPELAADAAVVHETMDFVSERLNDIVCEVNYDCFADGRKHYYRQLISSYRFHSERFAESRAIEVVDSAYRMLSRIEMPLPPYSRLVASGNNTLGEDTRANISWGYRRYNGPLTEGDTLCLVEGALLDSPPSHFALSETHNIPKGPEAKGAVDVTAIKAFFANLKKTRAGSENVRYGVNLGERANMSGELRLREPSEPENQITGLLQWTADVDQATFMQMVDLFLAHCWSNKNISVTYHRWNRFVVLQDHYARKIYAAILTFGTLHFLEADYTENPYLPSTWYKADLHSGKPKIYM